MVAHDSDLQGATLYQNEQPMGTAPLTLRYQADQAFRSGGCKSLAGTEVKWASGVCASVDRLTVCANAGYQQKFTFVRPDARLGARSTRITRFHFSAIASCKAPTQFS